MAVMRPYMPVSWRYDDKLNGDKLMPVGWKTPARNSAVIYIEGRIARLRDDKNVLTTRAGEAAFAKNQTRIDALKVQYETTLEKIALLEEVKREIANSNDYDW